MSNKGEPILIAGGKYQGKKGWLNVDKKKNSKSTHNIILEMMIPCWEPASGPAIMF